MCVTYPSMAASGGCAGSQDDENTTCAPLFSSRRFFICRAQSLDPVGKEDLRPAIRGTTSEQTRAQGHDNGSPNFRKYIVVRHNLSVIMTVGNKVGICHRLVGWTDAGI